jgi:hypothetical protein
MPSDGFELTYQLRPEDYRAMMRDFWRLTAFRFWRVKAVQTLGLLAGLGAVGLWWFSGDPVDLAFGCVLVLGPLCIPALNRLYYDRVFAKQRLGAGERRLRADAEGIKVSSETGVSQYLWSAVRRITEPPGAVLIWITPYQAVIAPNRAFADAAERDRFVAFARERTAGQGF